MYQITEFSKAAGVVALNVLLIVVGIWGLAMLLYLIASVISAYGDAVSKRRSHRFLVENLQSKVKNADITIKNLRKSMIACNDHINLLIMYLDHKQMSKVHDKDFDVESEFSAVLTECKNRLGEMVLHPYSKQHEVEHD